MSRDEVPAARLRSRVAPARAAVTAAAACAPVAALAFSDGGFAPQTWGRVSFPLLAVAALVLLLSPRALAPPAVALVAGLAGVAAWAAASTGWTSSVTLSLLEVERDLVYLAGAAVLVLVARASDAVWVVRGLLAATVAAAAANVALHVFPEWLAPQPPYGPGALALPLGYANAVGIVCTLGLLLALARAATATALVERAAAAAASIVLAPALVLSESRGAELALAAGLALALLLDGRRAHLLRALPLLAPAPVLAGLAAARWGALEGLDPAGAATGDGHLLGAALAALALLAAPLAAVSSRLAVPPRRREALAVLAAGACAAVLAAAVVVGGDALGSGGDRSEYWRVAWREFTARPLVGGGAGTFGQAWLRERRTTLQTADAHNLYLETLGETGLVGLALLAVALGAPLVAAWRLRGRPCACAVAGAYAAFLVHAALDFDWELPAVTLAGLGCGAALVVAAGGAGRERAPRASGVAAAAAVALAACAFVGAVGESLLAAADSALARGDWAAASAHARTARRWQPWSSRPWEELGLAQLRSGDAAAARSSFGRALAHDPRSARLWLELALASGGAERRRALARARRLNPLGGAPATASSR